METLAPLLKTLVALIVVIDPLGAVPIFLGLTHDQSARERAATANRAAIAVFLILLVSALVGQHVLHLFGISLASIRVAGGVLFLLMGLEMINARPSRTRQTPEETEEAELRDDVAVVPLALPQLAGPGAIGAVILLAQKGPLWPHLPVVAGLLLCVALVAWGALRLAEPLGKLLGRTGLNILTRVMGLIVVAVAVEFLVGGVAELWKTYFR